MRTISLYALFFFLLFLPIIFSRVYHDARDGFRLVKVLSKMPLESSSDLPVALLEGKTFSYLGKGRQCFAFAKGDLVIKLLRSDKIEPPFWASFVFKSKLVEKYGCRRDRMRQSLELASHDLQEETGVFYTHFSPSLDSCKATLIDKLGTSYEVDLAKIRFVLQKRATPLGKYFKEIKDVDLAKKAVRSYIETLASRLSKEIENKDYNWKQNYGVLQTSSSDIKVLEIDVGRLYQIPPHKKLTGPAAVDKIRYYSAGLKSYLEKENQTLAAFYEAVLIEVSENL